MHTFPDGISIRNKMRFTIASVRRVNLALALFFPLLVVLSLFSPAPADCQERLTLEARVRYQRAIEEVYWAHRIWPAENKSAKPPLNEVVPDSVILLKVEDYLKKSNALEEYWHRPVAPQQLQAEINRMVKQTRNGAMLQELFAALNNDPYVIAECLGRPNLVDRLVHDWYAGDPRFHNQVRTQAESELARFGYEGMKKMLGKYSETVFVKKSADELPAAHSLTGEEMDLSPEEWSDWMTKLERAFGQDPVPIDPLRVRTIPTHHPLSLQQASHLQEDETRYYVLAIVERQTERVRVATVEWPKVPFSSWWDAAKSNLSANTFETDYDYILPTISNSCNDDTWTLLGPPNFGRRYYTAIWTGTEMIIWGGSGSSTFLNTGGRYDPASSSWTPTDTTTAPAARYSHSAVWTGTKMIVWGGEGSGGRLKTGGLYDPASNMWANTDAANAPEARMGHTAVWTGSEMIVWGGPASYL